MVVHINADHVKPSVDELLVEDLKKAGLPSCIGNITPPMISRIIAISGEEILESAGNIPDANIVEHDLSKFIVFPEEAITHDLVLGVNGKKKLDKIKRDMSKAYVSHITNCLKCKYQSLCFNLTLTYLITVTASK